MLRKLTRRGVNIVPEYATGSFNYEIKDSRNALLQKVLLGGDDALQS